MTQRIYYHDCGIGVKFFCLKYVKICEEEKFRFTPEQIKAYSTVGGAPHLDGSYTVFGEVTEGMEVVENIEIAKTNRADRPVENIRILKASIQ